MADKSLKSRLQRLFSTNVIIRNIGGKKLKVADTSRVQHIAKQNLVDRYQKIYTGAGLSGYSDSLLVKSMRLNLFKDYESMDSDAILSSALDIYSDESTMKGQYGDVLEITTDNNQIKEILHNLFYDIINIEFNLWPWVRNMCKYGDFFLKLEINEKYGITNVVPLSVYDVSRIEGQDIDNPEYVQFLLEPVDTQHRYKREMSAEKTTLENYEVAHFRLLSDSNYLPYGKSQIEGGRKIWKQLCLRGDTKIWTPGGYVEIRDMKDADEVYSFDYNKQQVIPAKVVKWKHNGQDEIYEIRTSYRKLYANGSHPIMVSDGTYKRTLELTSDDSIVAPIHEINVGESPRLDLENQKIMAKLNTAGVFKAKEAIKKQSLAVECLECGHSFKRLIGNHLRKHQLTPTTYKEKHGERTSIYVEDRFLTGKIKLELNEAKSICDDLNIPHYNLKHYIPSSKDEIVYKKNVEDNFNEFVRFFGFMLGDGWIDNSNNTTSFSLGNRLDKSLKYVDFIDKIQLNSKIKFEGTTKAQCNVSSKYFALLLEQLEFKTGTLSKIVPEWVFKLNSAQQREFLYGFIDADGCEVKNGWQVGGINKKMINQLRVLAQRCGFHATNIVTAQGNGEIGYWGNVKKDVFSFGIKKSSNRVHFLSEFANTERVLGVKKVGTDDIFDIQVDNHFHNFIAEGMVVHNTLMEDAMLIHRIMRAPEKRIFKLDIGNIPPSEVENYMQKIITKMKKAPVMDDNGDYNLKYNMQNITEDFFLPVRGGDSGTSIDSLPGLTYEAIEDIEYLKNKLLAALRIPKAFIGFDENVNSKATLAAEDVRFARTIERIQRIVVSELTKIAIVHLYSQGYADADLVNFELKLTNPSTIYEEEKIELWNNKTSLASSLLSDGIVSTNWIYKNIFGFSDDEIKKVDDEIVFDYKQKFRRGQIENEGNDPAKTGESQGTPSDMAMGRTGHELDDKGGSPPGGWEGAGRPKEAPHYGKDGSARGRDPLGSHDMKKGGSGSLKYGKPLALAHFDSLKKSMKVGNKDKKIINESSEVEEVYKNEVSSSMNDV